MDFAERKRYKKLTPGDKKGLKKNQFIWRFCQEKTRVYQEDSLEYGFFQVPGKTPWGSFIYYITQLGRGRGSTLASLYDEYGK